MAENKTTELMRVDLNELLQNALFDDISFIDKYRPNAGLLIQRGLNKWQSKDERDKAIKEGKKTIKQELIEKITAVQASELYFLAFKRWLKHTTPTSDNAHFVAIGASITGRLFTGLPLGGTLETGVSTHHSYGVPMIAGSSVKGAVRAYTERLFAKRNDNGEIDFEKRRDKNGNETLHYQFDDDKKAIIDVLFGADDDDPNAGYLIWHDAWWIPPATGEQNRPFAPEVVTVHHQNYYNGSLTEALDIENPIPNQQLAVQGGFYFVIEGVSAWAKYAGTLLKQAINEQGLGAKSSSGYGYFVVDDKRLAPYQEALEKQQEQEQFQQLQAQMQNLSPNQRLIEEFKYHLGNNPEKWEKKSPTMSYKPLINDKHYEFADIYKEAMTWDDKQDIQAVYDMFLAYLPRFLGEKINQNKNWKKRINELKEKIDS